MGFITLIITLNSLYLTIPPVLDFYNNLKLDFE